MAFGKGSSSNQSGIIAGNKFEKMMDENDGQMIVLMMMMMMVFFVSLSS